MWCRGLALAALLRAATCLVVSPLPAPPTSALSPPLGTSRLHRAVLLRPQAVVSTCRFGSALQVRMSLKRTGETSAPSRDTGTPLEHPTRRSSCRTRYGELSYRVVQRPAPSHASQSLVYASTAHDMAQQMSKGMGRDRVQASSESAMDVIFVHGLGDPHPSPISQILRLARLTPGAGSLAQVPTAATANRLQKHLTQSVGCGGG